ncbi:hypothetical protein Cs7R123_12990 [Catellatospora sp. TT07R-123]|uniref:hypothetical protein n=1 Tax=Catellatospora sp. TT07R-123 TaxID=2733863 RepID=UPI001B10C5A5|nr:hypothetical protein [Catellatospora sp. TT07R-123]GHJ43957.1 hypothetical protein Cs7R123_12990 [Catellatospora sp. TT07R-123]
MLTGAVELEPAIDSAVAVMAAHVDFEGICCGCFFAPEGTLSVTTWWPCTVYLWAERVIEATG